MQVGVHFSSIGAAPLTGYFCETFRPFVQKHPTPSIRLLRCHCPGHNQGYEFSLVGSLSAVHHFQASTLNQRPDALAFV
jgi:hypothetical protein